MLAAICKSVICNLFYTMYKVLIVDDEFLARKLLQGYVEKMPELQLIGTAQNAFEAYSIAKEQAIDIMLLDIHMPDLNGLELARTLKNVPAIIFTTAYSEYALESYEVSAVDYLLKPIALPRFMQAIEKAIKIVNASLSDNTSANNENSEPEEENLPEAEASEPTASPSVQKDYMLVKADYKLYKINYADLLYIEGQHEYVSFYTTGKRITALYSLKSLEELLPQDRFIRVHKSYIVSIPLITEIDQVTVTVAGQKIPIGGSYREALLRRLGS